LHQLLTSTKKEFQAHRSPIFVGEKGERKKRKRVQSPSFAVPWKKDRGKKEVSLPIHIFPRGGKKKKEKEGPSPSP